MHYTKAQTEANLQKIPAIREMRQSGEVSIIDIGLKFNVSPNFVCKHCKDIKVDVKKNKKNKAKTLMSTIPCKTYTLDDLSPEEKQKYLSTKPSSTLDNTDTFITGNKGKYWNAAIFEDSRTGYKNEY